MPQLAASSHLCSPVWDTLPDTRFVTPPVTLGGEFATNIIANQQVLQRIYKYGGQPFARDYLAKHHGADFDKAFGKGTGKAIMHATAGRYEASPIGYEIASNVSLLV